MLIGERRVVEYEVCRKDERNSMGDANETLPIEIEPQEVKRLLDSGDDDVIVIDCRETDEHAIVCLPQAQLLPMSELERLRETLAPYRGRRIVVHCHHGGRSLQVAGWLRQQGYAKAQSMAGGIDRWAQEIDRSLPRY